MNRFRLPLVLALGVAAAAFAQAPPPEPGLPPGTLPLPPGPGGGATALVLEHVPPACVLSGQFPRLEATARPAGEVQGGRAYFRAESEPHWYYVQAERVGENVSAILPKPAGSTKGVRYYIEVSDAAFRVARTPEHVVLVVAEAGACGGKPMAKTAVTASIAVQVPPAAPAVPPGFLPDGVKP